MSNVRFLLISLFLFTIAGMTKADIADQLLASFGSRCPKIMTPTMTQVHELNNLLSRTIEEVRNQNECQSLFQNLNSLQDLSNRLSSYQTQRQENQSNLELRERLTRLTSLANDPFYSNIQTTILDEILNTQIDLVGSNVTVNYYENTRMSHHGNLAYQTAIQISSFINALENSPQCYASNSNLLTRAVGQGLQLASYFVAPGSAVGLASGGVLVESFNQFFRNFRFNNRIRDIDQQKLLDSLMCASEAFTKQYCETQDSLEILDNRVQNRGTTERLEGIDLISNHIDFNLKDWLIRLYAGSEFTSMGNLLDRQKPQLQIDYLRERQGRVQAIINERVEDLFEVLQGTDEVRKKNQYASLVQTMAYIIYPSDCVNIRCSNGPIHPFRERGFDAEIFVYTLHDPSITTLPVCEGSTSRCQSFAEYLNAKVQTPITISTVLNTQNNFNAVLDQVFAELEQERSNTNSDDPVNDLLSSYMEAGPSYSARETLIRTYQLATRIEEYLLEVAENDNLLNLGFNFATSKYYNYAYDVRVTKELTLEVIKMMNSLNIGSPLYLNPSCELTESIDETSLEEKAPHIVRCINKILLLDRRQSAFYFQKIRSMVRYELEARFENNEFDDNFVDILTLNQNNIVQAIIGSYPNNLSFFDIKRNMTQSQETLIGTYNEFFNTFKRAISVVLETRDNNTIGKQLMCFYALSYPQNHRDRFSRNIYNECKNIVLQGLYPENTLNFETEYTKPRKSRICALYKFDQKERLLDNNAFGN